MYVLCTECARLIDLAEGNVQQREVEDADLARHETEQHGLSIAASLVLETNCAPHQGIVKRAAYQSR
jgi:hypothetical protein